MSSQDPPDDVDGPVDVDPLTVADALLVEVGPTLEAWLVVIEVLGVDDELELVPPAPSSPKS